MKSLVMALMVFVTVHAAADEAQIRKNFDRYRSALASGDGKVAFSLLDSQSRAYYQEVLDKTRYATPEECAGFGALDKLTILLGRVSISPKELESFDAEGYFRYAVDNGWISQIGDESLTIERIAIQEDEALVYVRSGEEISRAAYVFRLENGDDWRLNITEMLPLGEESMKHHMERIGVDQEDFLFSTVESAVGERPTAKTWTPPLKKKG